MALLAHGLHVGVWEHPSIQGTTYFACPYGDRDRVHRVIHELEQQGTFTIGFASRRAEYLFSLPASGT